ncbi:2-[(L-alanin-3-ylcarbamoyl)methyl]-2-hydroxybutanedioate decarboxylase [Actinomadura sp. RB99]|uniref:alanine racemase n=1 Tax=Actinomadura sp. RB99 TaxID=2691577 RepID=UPI0019A01D1A|nr:alanine racemase [Actinomadura sp. RB99]MBD2898663.1 2-[(L-alanin-3-ylcarbamoyl)methyl]-2-hydroxybutanedioate decarboxylase [Actinomadura sp. RB99]
MAPSVPEISHAARANPDVPILRALASYVDGIEVASGGELAHVREAFPDARLAFGGPGKTDDELELALNLGVERIHVESPHELSRLARIAEAAGREVEVLLRVKLAGDRSGVALAMSGPFSMDPELMDTCTDTLTASPHVRLRAVYAHLASGLDASAMAAQSAEILAWGRAWLDRISHTGAREFNLRGGMAVDYSTPGTSFDWK